MRYRIGQKVRVKEFIKKPRPSHWNSSGKMDSFMGQVVTIRTAHSGDMFPYSIEENSKWRWKMTDFEEIKAEPYLDDKLFEI